MRVACLVSGGKDSILAAQVVRDAGWELDSFLTLLPQSAAPLLFHRPNARWVELQARAAGVPWRTEVVADDEDEEPALARVLSHLNVDGVVTGALASEYQRTRFERVAHRFGLKTFAPLWHHEPLQHLRDVIACGLQVRIIHIAADGLGPSWLNRPLDASAIVDLERLARTKRLNPAGEGGEYETFVSDAPLFSSRIDVRAGHAEQGRDHGTWVIDDAVVRPKNAA